MVKKYEIPEDDPQLVSESAAAYVQQYDYGHKMSVVAHENDFEWEDVVISNPGLFISEEELRRMGRECINTSCIAADDAISHFMNM